VRRDFPILGRSVHGKPLVYLDNGATSQKPQAVIDALSRYYREENANIHRGVHFLSEQATAAYEEARQKIQAFINAAHKEVIIFVRGTTEAVNLVAQSYGRSALKAGDEIIISAMEHHSNIVPWQMLRDEKGVVLRVAPISDAGELDLDAFAALLSPKTKLISITHVANALGTVVPVAEIVRLAKAQGIPVLIDGCQAVPHMAVDVAKLDCDFYVFSGHKLYGPSGIGVLYGKAAVLEAMPPWQGGGDMIRSVTFERTEYGDLPHKFEAGTPHISGPAGLAAAIDYVEDIGLDAIGAHERDLVQYATERLSAINSLRLIGTARDKAGVVSFVLEGMHPHDVGTILDHHGIAVRAGHHCAQPVMDRFGVPATVRASFGVYNSRADVDALVAGLGRVIEVLG
jgi:cysteine desulfurase/selenocysteine lyase